MKISNSWLRQYFNAEISTKEISEILTNTGLEIGGLETVETFPGGLKGLVIGEILTKEKHPNADRLNVTTVNIGNDEPLNIVCGAPNVAVGQKVVVATVGTTLYPTNGEPFKIKKGKIRGEASVGMICAEDEIGMGEGHDGIMVLKEDVEPGTPASTYFKVENDEVFEVDLTPNRSDAISHIGVARDLLASLKAMGKVNDDKQLEWPDVSQFKVDNTSNPIAVEVKDLEACPRYSGLTISGLKVTDSPDWIQNRLKAIGLKPINNIVDITNFVLHELGQPLHAFDADQIAGGKVIVGKLAANTSFTTLDEEDRKLSEDDLMICNENEGMCIAGVFGGIRSGVTAETKNIFIESAYFSPVGIRKTARRHGLNTDASYRYERGADPNITVYALKRAALLVKEIAGGEISSDIVDVYPEPITNLEVTLSYQNCDRLIGQSIDHDVIKSILESLDIKITKESEDVLTLSIPPYRADVKREVDVIEEILRIYGYNQIELPENMRSVMNFSDALNKEKTQQVVADYLSATGFTEIMSNSLTKSAYYEDKADHSINILNPLSQELGVLRQSLLFGALEAIAYNQNRKTGNVKFYEFGKTYQKNEGEFIEEKRLMLMMSGMLHTENWNQQDQEVDIYALKKFVWLVFERMGIEKRNLKLEELNSKQFEYGLHFLFKGKSIVQLGKVSKALHETFDLDRTVYCADFNWDNALSLAAQHKIEYQSVPKFQVVRRDLALLMDESVKFDTIEQVAYQSERKLLRSVQLFDIYQGKGLDPGKKSYAVSFLFRSDDKTLKDEQVDASIKRIYQQLTKETGAVLRQGEI